MAGSAFLYSDDLARYDYGDDHPFKPMRARSTLELAQRYDLLPSDGILRPKIEPADPAVLLSFHEPGYLAVLQRVSAGDFDLEALEHGIGTEDCPALTGIYEFSLLATGATLAGVDLVLQGKVDRAFNLVGGFHHAGKEHAEGFCYMNDVGVAIAYLLERGLRVAFIDIDAHHGNGVQTAFYGDDRALVISLHESGKTLYPWDGAETEIGEGRGKGFNVNVPLAAMTDDEVYLDTFRSLVPPLVTAFQPDLVLAEIGADALLSDPLTHLRLTTTGYRAVVDEVCRFSPKLVAVGGGGYDVYRTSRAWTLAWASMAGLEPVDSYAGLVGGMMYGAELDGLHDRPMPTMGEAKETARAEAARVVRYLQETVFPLLGARTP